MTASMLFSLCCLDTIITIVIIIIYYYWDYSATSYSAPQSVLATIREDEFGLTFRAVMNLFEYGAINGCQTRFSKLHEFMRVIIHKLLRVVLEEDVRDWVSDWSEPVGSLLSPKSKVSHCQVISCTRSTSALPNTHGQAFRMSVSETTLEHLWSNVLNSSPILSFVSALRQLQRLRTSPWPGTKTADIPGPS